MSMRKLLRWSLVTTCAGLALAGCQPSDTSTPALDPVEWLRALPFEPAPSEWPDVITTDLPEGFEAENPDSVMAELPGGGQVQATRVVYKRRAGGDGSIQEHIEVNIWAHPSLADRSAHLDYFVADEYQWSMEQYADGQVARYQEDDLDGRVWVAGPYLIVIFGRAEGRSASVDAFTEMYLAHPPSPGT